MLSVIEQFSVFQIIILSNLSITLLIILISVYLFSFIPNFTLKYHIIWWYYNIINNVKNIIFIILTIWFIIFFSNIIGMIPYSFTLTAQVIIVLSISIPTFISLNLLGFSYHRHNLLYLILPAGAPLLLIPIITLIELIAYFIRALSLTLRLSANMISGHILIKILLYALLSTKFSFLLSLILVPIIALEFLVAFLQAYVFLLLLISYYQDILLPH
jgi:ATP synthase subunit 6